MKNCTELGKPRDRVVQLTTIRLRLLRHRGEITDRSILRRRLESILMQLDMLGMNGRPVRRTLMIRRRL